MTCCGLRFAFVIRNTNQLWYHDIVYVGLCLSWGLSLSIRNRRRLSVKGPWTDHEP